MNSPNFFEDLASKASLIEKLESLRDNLITLFALLQTKKESGGYIASLWKDQLRFYSSLSDELLASLSAPVEEAFSKSLNEQLESVFNQTKTLIKQIGEEI